ncbi:MAG: Lrp/AsnC ligand binding domain-containing protein [Thermoplasmata archaeon]
MAGKKTDNKGDRKIVGITGWVMINTEPTRVRKVYEKLKGSKDIEEVHSITGKYDILVKIVAKNSADLGNIILDTVRNIDGVTGTVTFTELKV